MSTWGALYVTSEWIIRLVMLFYVPQRRDAAAARAWLLLIFFLPWAGLILYMIVGRAYLPRARLEMQLTVAKLIRELQPRILGRALAEPDLSPEYQPAVKLTQALGDFAVCRGNRFELITDYQVAIDRLVDDIQKAQRHVHLMYYIFRDDATGLRVAGALANAVARGVSCRVLGDGFGLPDASFLLAMRMAAERGVEVDLIVSDRSNKPIVQLAQESNYDDLLDAGVRIHRYYGNFLHAKHATIDADIALIGSSNLDNRSFALNNEVSVLIYDRTVVAELASIQSRYLAASHAIDPAQWAQRSIVRRVLQNMARLTDTLI